MRDQGLDPLRLGQGLARVLRLINVFALADELLGRDAKLADDRPQLLRSGRRLQVLDDAGFDAAVPQERARIPRCLSSLPARWANTT